VCLNGQVLNQTILLSVCRTKFIIPVQSWGQPTLIVESERGEIGAASHVLPVLVKFTLEKDTKAQRGSRGIGLLFL